ncbi:hypothetical protein EBZ38_04375 [bacterium]|nr:hypothetical protein [bacterium]
MDSTAIDAWVNAKKTRPIKVTFTKLQKGGGNDEASWAFYDTFVKKCKCNNGTCECTRKRESKRCTPTGCTDVKIPETKLEVLESHYNATQNEHLNNQSGGKAQYYGRKGKINIKVPNAVKNSALYAFKLKDMGFKGGLATGWKRAKQLATKDTIPIQDLKYIRAWFARHIYTSYPTYKAWKKAGRPKHSSYFRKNGIIAWLIWGGDAGFRWINSQKVLGLLNKHYNKKYTPIPKKLI